MTNDFCIIFLKHIFKKKMLLMIYYIQNLNANVAQFYIV